MSIMFSGDYVEFLDEEKPILTLFTPNVEVEIDDGRGPKGDPGSGGGSVDSVNGQVGIVALDADDIPDGSTKVTMTTVERTKLTGVTEGATANSSDATLLNRVNHTGNQAQSTVTDLVADLAAKASLVGGLVPTSQIPPLAINETFPVVSEAAMLALTAQRGDMAIRSDNGKTYVLASDSPATLADWKEVLATGQVQSVAGKTGVVALVKGDVGLGSVDNTADTAKPVSAAQQAALDGKAAASHTHPATAISDSTTTGRSVLTAASQTAARSAIGAGTSNLALGTTSSTALAGDYAQTYANAAPGSLFAIRYLPGGPWPSRPSARTDIHFEWQSADPAAPQPSGALTGVDSTLIATA